MRLVGIGTGLVLIAIAAALLVLSGQTEVVRRLRQGTPVYVLVVGVDPGNQADLVAVVACFPEGRTTWLSIPRHLGWPAPVGMAPLYTLYATEGVDGLARRVSALLEVPIPYWVVLDFPAFQKVVDLLGGVEVTVEERLVYQDRSQNLFIDIPAGKQTLLGDKALDYMRYQDGDEVGRIARQHQFLQAAWEKVRVLPWARWRELAAAGLKETRTNLSFWESLDLARLLRGGPSDRVTFAVVPTLPRPGSPREAIPDLVRLRKLTQSLISGAELYTRDEIRVLVLNGAGVRMLARKTGGWLADRGFQIVGMADADRSNYPRTQIIVRGETRGKAKVLLEVLTHAVSAPEGLQVLTDREFGVERLGGWPKEADVILVLGVGFDVRP